MIALYESLGRLPTPDEKERFLAAMVRQAGGERIYVAHRQLTADEVEPEIRRLAGEGYSLRRIASAVGLSKSAVQRVLGVPNPALYRDTA
jgi:DNA invertase Pin-like site-specific DNA recombinase